MCNDEVPPWSVVNKMFPTNAFDFPCYFKNPMDSLESMCSFSVVSLPVVVSFFTFFFVSLVIKITNYFVLFFGLSFISVQICVCLCGSFGPGYAGNKSSGHKASKSPRSTRAVVFFFGISSGSARFVSISVFFSVYKVFFYLFFFASPLFFLLLRFISVFFSVFFCSGHTRCGETEPEKAPVFEAWVKCGKWTRLPNQLYNYVHC